MTIHLHQPLGGLKAKISPIRMQIKLFLFIWDVFLFSIFSAIFWTKKCEYPTYNDI